MVELPADLVRNSFWPVRVRKADGSDRVRGRTECVRAHVADSYGLAGGPGRSRSGWSLELASTDAAGKPAANLLGSAELAPGERAGPGDQSPGAVVIWGLSLKER